MAPTGPCIMSTHNLCRCSDKACETRNIAIRLCLGESRPIVWASMAPSAGDFDRSWDEVSMSNEPLTGIQACVFDAYGTLFDFASAARNSRDVPADAMGKLTALWRDKQLQYTWLRALQGRHADFWQVTGDALDFA